MEKKFKVGDTVKLRSGGPVMTVSEVSESDGEVHCVWFDEQHQLKEIDLAFGIVTMINKSPIS